MSAPDRPRYITLPEGMTWEMVEAERAKWAIAAHMVPVAVAPGCVAWATINSVRQAPKPALPPLDPSVVDVQHETAYGSTVRLSRSVRVF